MSDSEPTTKLADLVSDLVPAGSALEGERGIEMMAAVLTEYADPEFVTVMVAESGVPQEYSGVDGFREALRDWISPYARFRLVIDRAIVREDRILFLARQLASTKHDGVELETASAALWSLEGGKVAQTTFYLDQQQALRAAGLEAADA